MRYLFRKHKDIFLPAAVILAIAVIWIATLTIPRISRAIDDFRHRLTNEDLLYDFDYLMALMEENFPFFGLSERVNGVDIRQLAAELRAEIEESGMTDAYDFYNAMITGFIHPIGQLGHLFFYHPSTYNDALEAYMSQLRTLGDHERWSDWYFASTEWLMLENFTRPETLRLIRRDIPMPEVIAAMPSPLDVTGVLETDILAEGKIAYVAVTRMANTAPHMSHIFRRTMYDFYTKIQDYEHLIIDLRGNHGGFADVFTHYVMGPIIPRTLRLTMTMFYRGGEHNLRWSDANMRFRRAFGAVAATRQPIENMPANMPYLNQDDFKLFDYFENVAFHISRVDWGLSFSGKVWVLIDGVTASGAEQAAIMSKYTGFATLVGESTRGMPAGPVISVTQISLPNTGLIGRMDYGYFVDAYGRLFEGYGVTPHYFNRPGMDALETVLAMIAEGQ
ncbi:MAG: hypothetical protein LBE35_08165 [Clostridiales bacterium]|jgi:hypothetical protein|nr:hypothetical protein [Clostridiales bacterium]